jgi:hypothetical protein
VEDDDVRRPHTGAERLQRPLIRLVCRLARDREALVPPFRDLPRGVRAEQREDDPHSDHEPAVSRDPVGETGEHPGEDTG